MSGQKPGFSTREELQVVDDFTTSTIDANGEAFLTVGAGGRSSRFSSPQTTGEDQPLS